MFCCFRIVYDEHNNELQYLCRNIHVCNKCFKYYKHNSFLFLYNYFLQCFKNKTIEPIYYKQKEMWNASKLCFLFETIFKITILQENVHRRDRNTAPTIEYHATCFSRQPAQQHGGQTSSTSSRHVTHMLPFVSGLWFLCAPCVRWAPCKSDVQWNVVHRCTMYISK